MTPRLKAGALRQRITLQSLQSVQDDSDGQVEAEYVALAEVWADVRMVSGREYVQADAKQSAIVATIRIRYRSDIVPTMRVLYGSRIFHVDAVLDDPNSGREWLTLACSEVRAG